MAPKLYNGYKQEQVSSLTKAAPSTDINQTYQNNARRTQGLISSINSLVGAAGSAVGAADKVLTEDAIQRGKREGGDLNKASSAGTFTWGGEEQQKAYNSVRAELVTRDMPSKIEEYLKNDSEIKKPMDEMDDNERSVAYGRARTKYFQDKGIDGSSYQEDANLVANDLQSKHLSLLNKQSVDLRQAKATRNVSDSVIADVKAHAGNPEGFETDLNAKFNKYAISLGGTKQAQEAIANGLLTAVMSPTPSMEALNYLKSKQAKDRFSSFEGFDQVVKQADTYTLKVQNAYKEQVKKQAESGFYINLSGGAFTDKKSVEGYLNSTNLDPETKFNLTNKALSYLKTSKGADDLQAAFHAGKYNEINAAKPEQRDELFKRMVGGPNDVLTTNMTLDRENALVDWIKKGNEVPKYISKFGDSPLNNGDAKAMDGQLKFYSSLKGRLGTSGTGTVFSSQTQGKMELYARLKADTTLAPADMKKALDEYDDGDKLNPAGVSFNAKINGELGKTGLFSFDIAEKMNSFAAEGGSNTFSGPDDLQPTMTFSDMTKAGSEPSLQYANDSLTGNYKAYRLAGVPQDAALERAKNDFQKKNQWVVWDEGSNKNSYIPKEFGDEFPKKSMQYLESTNVLKAIALAENTSIEDIRKKLTIQPSRDYNITRQLSVYVDGIEKNIPDAKGKNIASFNADQFHNEVKTMDKAQLDKVLRDYSIRASSPAYQEQQQQLTSVQALMRGMNFGP